LVFLHGGYWRALDKSDHSFVAPSLTQQGITVVVPNYALCPAVTIPEIVMQMVKALAWVWRHIDSWGGDASRIHVAGHSAGGHLAAMMLACDWRAYAPDLPPDLVKSVLSVSGLVLALALSNREHNQPQKKRHWRRRPRLRMWQGGIKMWPQKLPHLSRDRLKALFKNKQKPLNRKWLVFKKRLPQQQE
jgi:carboxylesterase type B